MSSFSDLPAELLIEILERCALNDPSSPPTLARVSSAFHAIVHGTPSLWQYMELRDDDHNIQSYQHKAKMWMAKSSPHPFEVDLYIERATDNILPLLHPIIPQLYRCRRVSIKGKRKEDYVFDTGGLVPPHAGKIVIAMRGGAEDEEDDADLLSGLAQPVRTFYQSQFSDTDCLSLYIRLTSLPHILPHLTPPDALAGIEALTIGTAWHGPGCVAPKLVLHLLRCFPRLRSFTYLGRIDPALIQAPDTDLPLVRMPHLTYLRLSSICSTRLLIAHLAAPALEDCVLESLNIDPSVTDGGEIFAADYLTHFGDAGQEEGAQIPDDPSQSPWSDWSTGRGIRALWANEPFSALRILEMDYADMRSRDFRFVFARLDRLETFKLVASDMSDRVFRWLAPSPDDDLPGTSEHGVFLPSLRNLNLIKCNRLSADVIVDVLTRRMVYCRLAQADKLSLPYALEEIHLVEMLGFHPAVDGARLRNSLAAAGFTVGSNTGQVKVICQDWA
ncbi:hypothetical protein K523DRAFT_281194 [Schizophyllum commune Tattone D]|nr:hypothetical protein K523DRAFT_281194 [Schizophyllum commune Tattone D]